MKRERPPYKPFDPAAYKTFKQAAAMSPEEFARVSVPMDAAGPDAVYDEVMAMSERDIQIELAKDGKTIEGVAADMKAVFERAKVEADMRLAIRAWLRCPADNRPTPAALGQRIAEIAASLTHC